MLSSINKLVCRYAEIIFPASFISRGFSLRILWFGLTSPKSTFVSKCKSVYSISTVCSLICNILDDACKYIKNTLWIKINSVLSSLLNSILVWLINIYGTLLFIEKLDQIEIYPLRLLCNFLIKRGTKMTDFLKFDHQNASSTKTWGQSYKTFRVIISNGTNKQVLVASQPSNLV
jgi:hypothetical protein